MTSPHLGLSYFGNRFLSHAKTDLDRISGVCDFVVHTVSEADLTYHKVVLAKIFAESRKRNLEVWADPWGLGGVFGGEAFSKFLLQNRDAWQVMSDGQRRPVACLNNALWRSYVKEWVLNVRDMGAQTIFWDEPHMALDVAAEIDGVYACHCDTCKILFEKQMGAKMPRSLNAKAREFRRLGMQSFLGEMLAFTHQHQLKNVLCLYAFKGIAEYDRAWDAAAALPYLHNFGCDPYWRWRGKYDPFSHVNEFSKRVVESAQKNKTDSHVWIQAMRLESGAEFEIESACRAAVSAGVTHVAAWSYDGGELLDTVLAENPARVKEVLFSTYEKIKKGVL